MELSDAKTRQQALDPSKSFLVQAPAGSGKTTLLVKRYLELLKVVQYPEECLAITFTRKATAEMRQRICEVLPNVLPNRLRILTIDAFCTSLVQNMPIISQFGGVPKITEDPTELYSQTVNRTIDKIDEKIIKHFDVNLEYIKELLMAILACREQWLELVMTIKSDPGQAREVLEQNLQNIIKQHKITACKLAPDTFLWEELEINDILTKANTIRKNKNIPQDLPENFVQQLIILKILSANKYSDEQWALVCALVEILPMLVAELQVTFRAEGLVDFTEVAITAVDSLGKIDFPSDLALSLDYKIKHILVDEFQDTSLLQFKLLELLTAGWQAGDGRSLFLVGDPQQSIYRFRQADVGLFLQVKQNGINELPINFIQLTSNFRSNATIINWLNTTFSRSFPQIEEQMFGAVGYTNAQATKDNLPEAVKLYTEFASETDLIIDIINQQTADVSIAILVRSRSHLLEILPALQANQISYQTTDIALMNENREVRDLFTLTQALHNLADRVAWLAVLRCPLAGLNLRDLNIIANADNYITIWHAIENHADLNLSLDSQTILARIKPIITNSLYNKGRLEPMPWVRDAWDNLGGNINHATMEYFKLLTEMGENICLDKKYINNINDANVQVMTIHKAKGLEFDVVIIPSMNKRAANDSKQLFLANNYLLAPAPANKYDENAIYNYLARVNKFSNKHEVLRLLYVAVTRAKQKLYLIGEVKNKPIKGSLLSYIWEEVADHAEQNLLAKQNDIVPHDPNIIYRIPVSYKFNKVVTNIINNDNIGIVEQNNQQYGDFTNNWQQHVGTVVHRTLAKLGLDNTKLEFTNTTWESMLLELGTNTGVEYVSQAMDNILSDEQGKWILDHTHQDIYNELAINNKSNMFSIDRTFVDKNNIRWVVDYKVWFNEDRLSSYKQQVSNYGRLIKGLFKDKEIKLGLYFLLEKRWMVF